MLYDLWWYVIDTTYMWYTNKRLKKWLPTVPPRKSFKEEHYMEWLKIHDPRQWFSQLGNENDK
jgi:hypothetical protein